MDKANLNEWEKVAKSRLKGRCIFFKLELAEGIVIKPLLYL